MNGKNEINELVTPEEAIELFKYAKAQELYIADALVQAYRATHGIDEDLRYDTMRITSFVYDTGRVNGIREERAKHKAKITKDRLKQFLLFTPGNIASIEESLDIKLDSTGTAELVAELIKANPTSAEEATKLKRADRIGWFVKNAYKLGFMTALLNHNDIIKSLIDSL